MLMDSATLHLRPSGRSQCGKFEIRTGTTLESIAERLRGYDVDGSRRGGGMGGK